MSPDTSHQMNWQYDPAPDFDQPITERLRRFPREPDMSVYAMRSMAALIIRGWLQAWHRLEITGREHLPAEGSFVMVANHTSHLDAICLCSALPLSRLHRTFPAAASDYFFQSVPRIWMSAVFINALPFGRQKHIRESIELCRALLSNPGNILILFPEGTRSKDGALGEFKPGIGMLLAGTSIPVLPCYVHGAHRAWPKGRLFSRPTKLRLQIGPSQIFQSRPADKESAISIARELQQTVQQMKGQTCN